MKDDFLWGGAISANQAEGAYLENQKGLSAFDKLPMNQTRLQDVYNDDKNIFNQDNEYYPSHQGINFYQNYQEDIKLLASLGIKCLRFSISWSRIFPLGDEEEPNQAGLQFYQNLINELKKYQIEPVITICHFDLPFHLVETYGGWSNRKVVDFYVNYAKTIMVAFKHDVQYWIPFNEMNMILHIPYIGGGLVFEHGENILQRKYRGAHHQLLANAKVIEIGKKINPNFKFGCMLAAGKKYAYTCKPEDVFATIVHERENLFFSDVQVRGVYPRYIKNYFKSHNINLKMESKDLETLKNNTVDFVSFSYYSSACCAANDEGLEKTTMNGPDTIRNPYLPKSHSVWQNDPLGLRITMNQLYERYQLPLFIVENGLGTKDILETDYQIHDQYRIDYLKEHIKNMIDCVKQDGVELIGYLMWGIIDLTSVSDGRLSKRYGVIYVDGDDYGQGTLKRYCKDSYYWYQQVIKSNGKYIYEKGKKNEGL